jgi:tripartite-type tricarboxylate transporter receptor subunit TctC
MLRSTLLATAAGVCLALVAASSAPAQEPFYKGKRLTLLVNFDAGSATDIDARIFARHFIKHVDGAPQLIIQNMPGGGGANGTMYLGEVAPKDGTTVGFLTATAWNFAAEPERFRVDFKKYEHIGYTGGTAVYYMRKDVPPGINKPTDIVTARDWCRAVSMPAPAATSRSG